jgi:hypothetical protein
MDYVIYMLIEATMCKAIFFLFSSRSIDSAEMHMHLNLSTKTVLQNKIRLGYLFVLKKASIRINKEKTDYV